jgi:hypothetical protein
MHGSWPLRVPWLRAVGVLASLLLLAEPFAHAKSSRAPKGTVSDDTIRVVVELFQVGLVDDETILYRRSERRLDHRGPDAAVAAMVANSPASAPFFAGPPAIIHSTSWHYESDGTVVLTYLAFGEGMASNARQAPDAKVVRKSDLPGIRPTDPDRPRPPTIKSEEVLSHGLRHLALLARRAGSEAFAARLGERSCKLFSSIEPEVAGELRAGAGLPALSPAAK